MVSEVKKNSDVLRLRSVVHDKHRYIITWEEMFCLLIIKTRMKDNGIKTVNMCSADRHLYNTTNELVITQAIDSTKYEPKELDP